eukprot:6486581-Amphidinium_carterae.1
MSYINAQFVAQKYVARANRATGLAISRRASKRSAGLTFVQPASKVQKVTKRRGAGGAFRAFVNERSKGQKGRPDLQGLAHEYRQHKQQNTTVFQDSCRRGRAATA